MNTKDLAYFDRLIKLKNFSQVALEFGVTQPTITTAIKRLETDFGSKLVLRDRVHNTLTVTASGQQLADPCSGYSGKNGAGPSRDQQSDTTANGTRIAANH